MLKIILVELTAGLKRDVLLNTLKLSVFEIISTFLQSCSGIKTHRKADKMIECI